VISLNAEPEAIQEKKKRKEIIIEKDDLMGITLK